jgi:cytochrome c-type biogenesis protein CcmH/NrfG
MRSSHLRTVSRPVATLVGTALLSMAALAACEGEGVGERIPLDRMGGAEEVAEALPAELQLQLDSGNAAYRAREYDRAVVHFSEVAARAPGLAAGWYGIGMAQMALGNAEAADSAMMRVHQLAPEIPLRHPATDAPPNPHPASPPGAAGAGGSGSR